MKHLERHIIVDLNNKMNTTTSLFDLLSRKDYFDLLIHFQDRENYGKEQLQKEFDDDDLEYIEDDDHNIIEIRHRYFYFY